MAMDRVDPKAAAARGATFALAAWRLIMRAVVIISFVMVYFLMAFSWWELGVGFLDLGFGSREVEVALLPFLRSSFERSAVLEILF